MKMFKKLMAIALAGVMALAILTGCANYKNLIQLINDAANRRNYGFTVSEDAELTKKAKAVASKIEAEGKNLTDEKVEAILTEVLGDKHEENYVVAETRPVDAKNSFAKDYYTMENAEILAATMSNQIPEGKTVKKIGITTCYNAKADKTFLMVIGQLEDKAK